MAWGAQESRQRCAEEIKENILAFMRGEQRNRVDLL
jgi:lactate dehydrogenase-like 2-hydroxyacid dehydrogenase